MKIILIGSPGAGKGTQAKILCKHFDIAHISTGDLLREEIAIKSKLGLEITQIMESGQLVSDEIVCTLLANRIKKDDCKNGFILDGYPRNLSQAETLHNVVGEIDKVIFISVPDEFIIERMVGRRICTECGATFHISLNPPKLENVCDLCNSSLEQRKDDNEKTVKNRLSVFHLSTSPIIDFYKNKGLLAEISGVGDIQDISKNIINSIN